MGSIWKRCTHDGATTNTGLPGRGKKPAIPACRCTGGAWYWRTDLPAGPDEKRRQVTGHEPTKALAIEALRDVETKIAAGGLSGDPNLTVGQWLTDWLAAGTWKPKARAGYASDVRAYLIPHLGGIRLRDLRRKDVRTMLGTLAAAGKSGHVCDKARRTLRAALSVAVADELIAVNVADGRITEIPRRGKPVGAILEVEQVRRFIEHAKGDPLYSLWVVGAFTGLRRGELLGTPWVDVSLTGDTPGDYPGIVVRQTVVELAGLHRCPVCGGEHQGRFIQQTTAEHAGAKTEAGTGRWVPLTAEGVDALLTLRAVQESTDRVDGLWVDHGLVWPDLDGGPLHPKVVTQRFKALVTEAGLPELTPKGLRRGAVSMLASVDLPLELVAILVGHAGTEVTRQHYLRGLRSTLAGAAEDVAKLVRGDLGHVDPATTERYAGE